MGDIVQVVTPVDGNTSIELFHPAPDESLKAIISGGRDMCRKRLK